MQTVSSATALNFQSRLLYTRKFEVGRIKLTRSLTHVVAVQDVIAVFLCAYSYYVTDPSVSCTRLGRFDVYIAINAS